MHRRSLSGARGFALAESVTALFIASVGLFGSLQMFQYCVREIRAIGELESAARIVQNEIETLRAQPFDSVEIGDGRAFVSASPEIKALYGARASTNVSADPQMPARLKQVTAVIAWRTIGGRRAERRLTTLIAREDRP